MTELRRASSRPHSVRHTTSAQPARPTTTCPFTSLDQSHFRPGDVSARALEAKTLSLLGMIGDRDLRATPDRLAPILRSVALQLQRTHGNHTVQRIFGRGKKARQPNNEPAAGSKTKRETFDEQVFERQNWEPSTGKGKFDAVYRPREGILYITVKVHFTFENLGSEFRDLVQNPKDLKWSEDQKRRGKSRLSIRCC